MLLAIVQAVVYRTSNRDSIPLWCPVHTPGVVVDVFVGGVVVVAVVAAAVIVMGEVGGTRDDRRQHNNNRSMM